MSTAALTRPRAGPRLSPELLRRLAPAAVAAAFAAAYVIISPPSLDLAAQLFRAQLFRAEGFGIWDNWWYSGHDIVGYSVLFPAVSAWLSPQLAAAIAATGSAVLFERLARRHFGPDAWLGAVLFGAATATDLYTGRLAFAFGAMPALAAVLALDHGRHKLACSLGFLSALCSPVAAVFCALAAGGYAIGGLLADRRLWSALPGAAVALAALAPVGLVAIAFPEGGIEPFGVSTLWPILAICVLGLLAVPRERVALRAGVAIYGLATLGSYVAPSPVGSNMARLGTFLALALAALVWWRRRPWLLLALALPLAFLEWEAPVRDLTTSSGDPSVSTAYYQPLLRFLERQTGPPFRIEIPFTQFHWEAYVVATHFPIARGWERQLDIADNPIFYSGHLTAATYARWLHQNAVRFVAAPDANLDYSAKAEMALIDRGLPYLHQVMRSRHWRVYQVADVTPIVQGPATLKQLGPDSLTIAAHAPSTLFVHVRFTPYWALSGGEGCVAPAGPYTRITVKTPGTVRLVTRFAIDRIAADSPRCN
jgi:hypothetical protein